MEPVDETFASSKYLIRLRYFKPRPSIIQGSYFLDTAETEEEAKNLVEFYTNLKPMYTFAYSFLTDDSVTKIYEYVENQKEWWDLSEA